MSTSPITLWARFYADCGWNPIPSCRCRKGPAIKGYARYRDGEPIPPAWLRRWTWPNIQLGLGVPWGLLVIDVDGPRALWCWHDWHLMGREWPETWTVQTRSGLHFWYRIPPGIRACPSRAIWLDSPGRPHSEIRVLGDRSLVIAPPSRHVKEPHPYYAFLPGRGPNDLYLPAVAPFWIFRCPERTPPLPPRNPYVGNLRETNAIRFEGGYRDVASIPDSVKIDLARSWGLRFDSGVPGSNGWLYCRAIDREDRNPSAGFDPRTGVYWQNDRRAMSFLTLGITLGAFRDYRDACRQLGLEKR